MNTTTRDSKMMETLGRFGVLSTEQLSRMFFPGTALTTVRRRLRLMEDERLIYRVRGLDAGGVAWALTKRTAQKLGSVYPARSFSRNSINHDVALSEVLGHLRGGFLRFTRRLNKNASKCFSRHSIVEGGQGLT